MTGAGHRLCLVAALAAAVAASAAWTSAPSASTRGAARPGPDLVVSRITHPTTSLAPGSPLRVAVIVANRGRRSAPQAGVRLYASRDARRDSSDVLLPPALRSSKIRAHGVNRLEWRNTVPGGVTRATPLRLLVCVDPGRRIAESNERNNCRAAPGRFTIRPKAGGTPVDGEYTIALSLRSDGSFVRSCGDGTEASGRMTFTLDYEYPQAVTVPVPFDAVGGGGGSGQVSGKDCFGPPCSGPVGLVQNVPIATPPGVPKGLLRILMEDVDGGYSVEVLAGLSFSCGLFEDHFVVTGFLARQAVGDRVIRVPLSATSTESGYSQNSTGTLTLTLSN